MRVAIVSDIHDNIPKLRQALAGMEGVDVLVCLGDLCSPFIVRELGEGFRGPIHVVFGNNDGDRFRLTTSALGYPQITVHGEYVELDLDGRRFAIQHLDNIGRALAAGGRFDVVCFGHSHQFKLERTGNGRTLVVNPGEIFGGLTGRSTYVIYDTVPGEAARVDV